jgi:hypothetical protein
VSYREENGQVILTMSREDYELLVYGFGMLIGKSFFGGSPHGLIEYFNRLNSGNPNYTPYKLSSPSPSSADSTQRERKTKT